MSNGGSRERREVEKQREGIPGRRNIIGKAQRHKTAQ